MKNTKKLINFINHAVDFTDKTGIIVDFAFTSNWRLKSFKSLRSSFLKLRYEVITTITNPIRITTSTGIITDAYVYNTKLSSFIILLLFLK